MTETFEAGGTRTVCSPIELLFFLLIAALSASRDVDGQPARSLPALSQPSALAAVRLHSLSAAYSASPCPFQSSVADAGSWENFAEAEAAKWALAQTARATTGHR